MEQTDRKNKTFSIEEAFYKEHLEPTIAGAFAPASLIHFTFSLPFQFPVKDGTLFYLVYNNNAHFFHLDKFGDNRKEPLFAGDPGIDHPKLRTRVESVIISKEDLSALDSQGIHSHFCAFTE